MNFQGGDFFLTSLSPPLVGTDGVHHRVGGGKRHLVAQRLPQPLPRLPSRLPQALKRKTR